MFEFGKKGQPDSPEENRDPPRQERPITMETQPRPQSAPASAGRRETATIGPSIQLDGDLRGQEDLYVEGEVNGTIHLRNNTLTVGAQGKVKANVFANEVIVEGYVEGDVYGAERVVVRKSAEIRGNVTSPRVSLEEGARFKGSIEMDSEAVERQLGKTRGASPAGDGPKAAEPLRPTGPTVVKSGSTG
jgi:cytoskeletal protein CcmA (bactofilin family)